MPGIWQDSGLTLRTIDGKELIGFVIGIAITHRYDNLTCLDIELTSSERLVNPELLDVYLTAFLHFCLIFASLLGLYLYSSTIATMLELNLRTHGPTLAKIITNIQTHMWQVETSMTLVIGIKLWFLVTIKTLTIKVACHHSLAIATDM